MRIFKHYYACTVKHKKKTCDWNNNTRKIIEIVLKKENTILKNNGFKRVSKCNKKMINSNRNI